MPDSLLTTVDLSKQFREFTAVDGISVSFHEDETTAIIGPNGAGKTTFFNLLSGILKPTAGEIWFQGDRIDGREPSEIAMRGIARSYQITNIFSELSTIENVRLSAQARHTGFRPRHFLDHFVENRAARDDAEAVLVKVGLADEAETRASELSHGMRRHLDIAVALASEPELLLLDEPTAGMSSSETSEMSALIEEIAEELTVVIIEHDMDVVMGVADRIAVMHRGMLLTVGTPEEVRQNQQVRDVYLSGGSGR